MKNLCIIFISLVFVAMPMIGCSTVGGDRGWQNDVVKLSNDIFTFSKLATRIALTEAKTSVNDVELIEGYLVALRDILSVPGQPNFAGARGLVGIKLPSKYQIYGLTIIDVLERYLRTAKLNITEDQEDIIMLISSGIDGAIAAVREFAA